MVLKFMKYFLNTSNQRCLKCLIQNNHHLAAISLAVPNYFKVNKIVINNSCKSKYSSHVDDKTIETIVDKVISLYSDNKFTPIISKAMPLALQEFFKHQLEQVIGMKEDKKELQELEAETIDQEFKKLANEDILNLNNKLLSQKKLIFEELLNFTTVSDVDEFYLEVSAGIGGQEAMLFAQDLKEMYMNYCLLNRWEVYNVSQEDSSLGGVRRCCLLIKGQNSYTKLRYEGGIHRVQRTPKTEKAGRVHTSTASVAILPVPSEITIKIDNKDLKIDTMKASGAGGQHVNKTESAVRITHLPTGLSTECQTSRSQDANRKEAMRKLRAMIYEKELDKQEIKISSLKKLQVGTKSRSEKIRTYNFPQDRITDHRVGVNVHNVSDFLAGGSSLENLISKLIHTGNIERITVLLNTS